MARAASPARHEFNRVTVSHPHTATPTAACAHQYDAGVESAMVRVQR